MGLLLSEHLTQYLQADLTLLEISIKEELDIETTIIFEENNYSSGLMLEITVHDDDLTKIEIDLGCDFKINTFYELTRELVLDEVRQNLNIEEEETEVEIYA